MAKRSGTFTIPRREGNLEIGGQIIGGRYLGVEICGDPAGLRYLAKILNSVADVDQAKYTLPDLRFHIHLHPGDSLVGDSCEVVIGRADAPQTGELPDSMK